MDSSHDSHQDSIPSSAFTELDDFDDQLDELEIPDSTYRQLKELHQALVEKARRLEVFQSELERQKAEFELARQNFEAVRIQSRRETTEARLERIVRFDRVPDARDSDFSEIDLIEITEPSADSDRTAPIQPGTDLASSQAPLSEDDHPEIPLDPMAESGVELDPVSPAGHQNPPDPEALVRFRNSVRELREKSEVISAVFVELDQMVRDLNRQQELLEELNLNPASASTSELNSVNHQLKRRFHRLSRQIKVQ